MRIDQYILDKWIGYIPDGNDYHLFWGSPPIDAYGWGDKYGVMETGFFKDSLHIDTVGLYQYSSLAFADIDYEPPKEVSPASKYEQPVNSYRHDGVVLALQKPDDHSIRAVTSPKKYYQFVYHACKFYGSKLFLKLHPLNNSKPLRLFKWMADKFGCGIGKVCLSECDFVLTYNSTYAVDCFCKGIPVAQFAPGYFWQTPAVNYTNYEYPVKINADTDAGYRLRDFLLWRYCFHKDVNYSKLLKVFSLSSEIFPLSEELSYGQYLASLAQ